MPAICLDLTEADVEIGTFEGLDELFCLVGRIEPVRGVADHQKLDRHGADILDRLGRRFPIHQVEIVGCLSDVEHRIGVETFDKL